MLNFRKLLNGAAANWPAKMLSVALAIILFVFHRMSTLQDRSFQAPLSIEVQEGLIPASSYPQVIRVTLRGDAAGINLIQEGDIETYADLLRYGEPGEYRAAVQVRKRGTAQGVEPLQIEVDPQEISLFLDKKVSKFVPVTPALRGTVEQGYVLSSHSLNPAQVIVDGPEKLMESVTALTTDFIDLDGRTGDFTTMVDILKRDPLIVLQGTGQTEFRGSVNRIIPVRNISDIPIRILGLATGLSGELDVRAGKARLEGETQDQLDNFRLPLDFLYVDCSQISGPGAYTLQVQATPAPQGIRPVITPGEVTILVSAPQPAAGKGGAGGTRR